MVQLLEIDISQQTKDKLVSFQSEVDTLPTYEEQSKEAKRLWPLKKRNPAFKEIKDVLAQMSSCSNRCHYCEDSLADEIEHFYPKDLYPDKAFVWDNYLLSCGPCNGAKSNQFAIFDPITDEMVWLDKNRPIEAPTGKAVLINPRKEDPLPFLFLDLSDTFFFEPFEDEEDTLEYKRAEYSIDTLQLNQRGLDKQRKNAFGNYRARLKEYISSKKENQPVEVLNNIIAGLRAEQHPFVWKEMKRQQARLPELKELFDLAPEAFDW